MWLLTGGVLRGQGTNLADSIEQRISRCFEQGRLVDRPSPEAFRDPAAEFLLSPAGGDLKYAILIYGVRILPEYAVFSAGMVFRDPRSGERIAFAASNQKFSYQHGLAGPVKLLLLSSLKTRIGTIAEIRIGSRPEPCYAEFDCNGLREFSVSGDIVFNKQQVMAESADGHVDAGSAVQAAFQLRMKTWEDFLLKVDLPAFQLRCLPGFSFRISNAILDLSETANHSAAVFPEGYCREYLGGNDVLWQGFYLVSGELRMPGYFKGGNGSRIGIGLSDFFIDASGMTGKIHGYNLLGLEEGRLGTWAFSIDQLILGFYAGRLVQAGMKGDMGLPILPDTSSLRYEAMVAQNDQYLFTVATRNRLRIPAFQAEQLYFDRGSWVQLRIEEGKLTAASCLSGGFDIRSSGSIAGIPQVNISGVRFRNLKLSNQQPRLDIEYLGIENNPDRQVSKFPINIYKIYLIKEQNRYYLKSDFRICLSKEVSAAGALGLQTEMKEISGRDKLVFGKCILDDLQVKAQFSGFFMAGQISFLRGNALYGDGFRGTLALAIEKLGLKASAGVLFGNVSNTRYWYADAMVMLGTAGIPIAPGIEIYGMMGGVWNQVRQLKPGESLPSGAGTESSGLTYIPDAASGLGFRAGAMLKGSGNRSFLAKAILEMQFNRNGGLDELSFYGDAEAMPESIPADAGAMGAATRPILRSGGSANWVNSYVPSSKICGPFSLRMDFVNRSFEGRCAVFLNGIGNNALSGSGINGKAGEMALYFSRSKWYFYVGTPLQPLGVIANLGNAGKAMFGAYFMAGSEVLPAAPLPSEITKELGFVSSDAFRQAADMASGAAFAFGAQFRASFGSDPSLQNKNLSFYAAMQAIAGFDFNMSRYGKDAYCSGRGGSLGVNGWYAIGQLYLYARCDVGAQVKGTRINVLSMAFAAAVEGSGPNPVYLKGAFSFSCNVLGIFRGSVRLKYQLGEPCEIQVSKPSSEPVIVSAQPWGEPRAASPYRPVTVVFSSPINTEFRAMGGRTFMYKLITMEVQTGGKPLNCSTRWNTPGLQAELLPLAAFPALTSCRIEVRVDLYEKLGRNWQPVRMAGEWVTEKLQKDFTPAAYGTGIDLDNVLYSWPAPAQVNYFRNEGSTARMVLRTELRTLQVPGTKILAIFADATNKVIAESPVTVNGKMLEWKSPTVLQAASVYTFRLLRVPLNFTGYTGSGSTMNTAGKAGVMNTSAPATAYVSVTRLLEFGFRTSAYESSIAKMQPASVLQWNLSDVSTGVLSFPDGENFESAELLGTADLPPFWQAVSQRTLEPAYAEFTRRLYSVYSLSGAVIWPYIRPERDTAVFGLKPVRTVRISQPELTSVKYTDPSPWTRSATVELSDFSRSAVAADFEQLKTGLLKYSMLPGRDEGLLEKILSTLENGTAVAAPVTITIASPVLGAVFIAPGMGKIGYSVLVAPTVLPPLTGVSPDWPLRIRQLQMPDAVPGSGMEISFRYSHLGITVSNALITKKIKAESADARE